jgi:hypothetical protein
MPREVKVQSLRPIAAEVGDVTPDFDGGIRDRLR